MGPSGGSILTWVGERRLHLLCCCDLREETEGLIGSRGTTTEKRKPAGSLPGFLAISTLNSHKR